MSPTLYSWEIVSNIAIGVPCFSDSLCTRQSIFTDFITKSDRNFTLNLGGTISIIVAG